MNLKDIKKQFVSIQYEVENNNKRHNDILKHLKQHKLKIDQEEDKMKNNDELRIYR